MSRLRRVNCSQPGLSRRRCGKGFIYCDLKGRRIEDEEVLTRIRSLAIPPAWADVWISPWANGHIQAIGIDAAGRKQYIYHPIWRDRRNKQKFDKVLGFAQGLPDMRAAIAAPLAERGLSRERVLACALRMLDLGAFRIGGERYAEEHNTFGLATLRTDHVSLIADGVGFHYVGKHCIERNITIHDAAVKAVIRDLMKAERTHSELLGWYRPDGSWRDCHSSDINQYLKEITTPDASAKDFRTWHGTQLAAVHLAEADQPSAMTQRRRVVNAVIKQVAEFLGNTPAVCRGSYIDPRVIDRYNEGMTIAPAIAALGPGDPLVDSELQVALERAVIDLLEGTRFAPMVTKAA